MNERGNEQHPDMMCEVFIRAPTDLLDADEMPPAERVPAGARYALSVARDAAADGLASTADGQDRA